MKTVVSLFLLLALIGIDPAEPCADRAKPKKIPVGAVIDVGAVCDERSLSPVSFSKSGYSKLMGFFTPWSRKTHIVCPIQLVKRRIVRCKTLLVAITVKNGDKNRRKRFTCTAGTMQEDGTSAETDTVGGFLGAGTTKTYFFDPLFQSTGGLHVECTLPRSVSIVQIAHWPP